MKTYKQRGGSQIGWVSASWPLASVEVEAGKLTFRSMGTYEFTPSDITAVEAVGLLPVLSTGVRIHHNKSQYPERVVFLTLTGRDQLLAALRGAGFKVGQPASRVRRGFPMRIPAVVAVVVLWNLLFFLDQPNGDARSWTPGASALAAIAGLFALATLLPRSKRLQQLFMRSGRDVGEMSSLLSLIRLVSGLMLIVMVVTRLAQ